MLPDLTPERWSSLSGLANFVLLAGAIVVAIGTWLQIKTSSATTLLAREREKEANERIALADERISENEVKTAAALADAASAGERASTAEQRAAEAEERTALLAADTAKTQERTAKLETEAANARLETERIKESLAWRRVPIDRVDEFRTYLSNNKGSVNIVHTLGDPEAQLLATELAIIFQESGWNIGFSNVEMSNTIIMGLSVMPPSVEAVNIAKAMKILHMPVAIDEPPTPATSKSSGSRIKGAPTLLLASR